MRALGIEDVEHFPFPTMPRASAVSTALNTLKYLAAISDKWFGNNNNNSSSDLISLKTNHQLKQPKQHAKLTSLGKLISKFPIR